MKKRKICIALTTRGNYGKMKSVMAAIQKDESLELQVVLGGMVVLEKYGRIQPLMEANGFPVSRTVNFVVEGENLITMAKSSGLAVYEFANAFDDLKPDLVIVIADRFECVPIAMAAAYMNIAVAHVEGGEVSGSIDESIRHCLTKLSHVHFPASQDAANRIIKMGEDPAKVHMVGGTSMDVIRQLDLTDLAPLKAYQKEYGMGPLIDLVAGQYLLLSQHPVTTEYDDNLEHLSETIKAIEELHMPTLWVMPNMDAGADGVNKAIRKFREVQKPDYVHFFKSLPIDLYAPAMNNAICMMGNSSSGIRESAFLGVPSVNIGTRQNQRARGVNVIDAPYKAEAIVAAVRQQIAHGRYEPDHLYGDGYAGERIVKVLANDNIQIQKTIMY